MNFSLINRKLVVTALDLSADSIEGTVIYATDDRVALRLSKPIVLNNGDMAPYLVASIRHEGKSTQDIICGQNVVCGITLVPASRFDSRNPCDTSWWRGGGAAIGEIFLSPAPKLFTGRKSDNLPE